MLQNIIEMDLKEKLMENNQTQKSLAGRVGCSNTYVNRVAKGKEQIINQMFVKMMDELGYDVELIYNKKPEGAIDR